MPKMIFNGSKEGTRIVLMALFITFAMLLFGSTGDSFAATQDVTIANQSAAPDVGDTVTFDVQYSTSDGLKANSDGFAAEIYFDSTALQFQGITVVYTTDKLSSDAVGGEKSEDATHTDGLTATDKYAAFSYLSFSTAWPDSAVTYPLTLATVSFKALKSGETTINVKPVAASPYTDGTMKPVVVTVSSGATTAPAVTTISPATNITSTGATVDGNVTAEGTASVTSRGICVGTTANPTTGCTEAATAGGAGTFSVTLTGLTPSTNYFARAYATSTAGTSYGADVQFTTAGPSVPTVTTTTASAITATTATSGGNVDSDGGSSVTARGVCVSTTAAPAVGGTCTTDGTGTGSFTSSLTGLTASTTYHIRAYATNANGTGYGSDLTFTTTCTPPTITVTPTAATDPAIGVEAGTSVTFEGSASGNWTFGDGGTATDTDKPAAHPYVNAGSYTVTLTVGGCSATAKVTVVPKDCSTLTKSAFTATHTGLSVAFAVTGAVTGNTFTWNFGETGGTTTDGTTATPTHVFSAAGTYTISVTASNGAGCTSTSSQQINVGCAAANKPNITAPAAPITGTAGTPITFTSDVAANWDFGDGGTASNTATPPDHTYANGGNYTVTVTASGCSNTAAVAVSSACAPGDMAKISLSATSPEAGTPYVLGNGTTLTPPTEFTTDQVVWKVANVVVPNTGTSPFNVSYTFPSAGDYLLSLTTTVGTCTSTDTKMVTVTPAKKKSVILANGAAAVPTVKPGDAVTFTNQNGSFFEFSQWVITAPNAADNFSLDTPDAVTYTFATAGTYTIALSGIGGTGDTAAATPMTIIVSLTPPTAPSITTLVPSSGTVGSLPTSITINGDNFAANSQVYSCTGNTTNPPTGCTLLTGTPSVNLSFSTTSPKNQITGVALPSASPAGPYYIFVNNPSNPANSAWSNSATFTVNPVGSSSIISAVSTTTNTVYAGVATQLRITGQGTNFAATSKVYYTSSTGAACGTALPATRTPINSTNNNPVASPAPTATSITTQSVTFPSVGNYCIFICDAADANCVSYNLYASQQGGSDTPVVPSFGIDSITGNGSTTQITGVTDFTVKFVSTISGSVWSYLWDFGDGETSTEATPTHVYKAQGLYTVKLTVYSFLNLNSATKEVKDFVKVVAPPAAKFTCSATSGKAPLTVTCTADTYPGATKYAWDFGDSQTGEGQSVSHTFGAVGTFTITMTVTYDDAALTRALKTATATATIVVTSALTCDTVTAAFTANPMTGTRPLTVNFDASASANADGYSWTFGDNQTGSGKNVSHTFAAAGTYTVTLKTTNSALAGCEKSATQSIVVSEKTCEVTAVFTASTLIGDAPLIVNFDATASAKATSFAWTFGDGESGSGVTATHTYSKAGTYTVTLTAKDDVCTKTATQTIQAMASDRPGKPILLSPENGVTTRVPLTPTLKTQSNYSSPVNSPHAKTRWQIATDADFKNVVYDVTNTTNLTSIWVPDFMLMEDTKYWWRAQYIDNRSYASDWADPFTMLTVQINPEDVNGNGVPETQEITDANSDIDANGVADTKQTDAIFAKMGTKGASGIKVVTANFAGWLKYINMSTLPTAPAGYDFPWGAMTFRVETKNIGDSAVITIYFSEALPSGAKWFNYNQIEGWKDYSQYATFSANGKVVTITLKDGGVGDADGTANGAIVDPAAIGIPTTAPAPDVCLDCDSDSGGCFISTVSGVGVNAASAAMLTLATITGIFFGRRKK